MKKVLILCMILSLGIYAVRLFFNQGKPPDTLFVTQPGGQQTINPKVFTSVVENPYREQLANQMFTFLVFMDPERLCPVVLDEMAIWVAPKRVMGMHMYDVVIFVSEAELSENVWTLLNQHHLDKSNLVVFPREGRERNFSQFGVLKILYSQAEGVVFHEFGNKNPEDFRNLEKKIMAVLTPELNEEEP